MSENPYEQPPWLEGTRPFRPGGLTLTARLVAQGGLLPGASVLDVGCGAGESTAWLTAQGYAATGLDCSERLIDAARRRHPHCRFAVGDGAAPPFPTGSLDGVLLECVLSLLPPDRALAAYGRILRPGGKLLLSDVYAKVGGHGLYTEADYRAHIAAAGFAVLGFADCSAALGDFLAQAVMDGENPYTLLGCACTNLKPAKVGSACGKGPFGPFPQAEQTGHLTRLPPTGGLSGALRAPPRESGGSPPPFHTLPPSDGGHFRVYRQPEHAKVGYCLLWAEREEERHEG